MSQLLKPEKGNYFQVIRNHYFIYNEDTNSILIYKKDYAQSNYNKEIVERMISIYIKEGLIESATVKQIEFALMPINLNDFC